MKSHLSYIKYVIVGKIKKSWIATPNGSLINDQISGSLLYSMAGAKTWDENIGLVGKVNSDFQISSMNWLKNISVDLRGVTPSKDLFEMREFFDYEKYDDVVAYDPIRYFSRHNLAFPRGLLGYASPSLRMDSKTVPENYSIRESDIPLDYLEATAVHIAPIDYSSHLALPSYFRNHGVSTITLDPAIGYMHPSFLRDIPVLFKGVTALITSEKKLQALFTGKDIGLWDIVDFLIGLGIEILVIKRGSKGQLLYDGTQKKRWEIPAYPVKVYDPTGCGDSFCGGFLAGYRSTYSSLEATLYGNVAASICLESRSPRSQLEFMNGLLQLRLEALREKIRVL